MGFWMLYSLHRRVLEDTKDGLIIVDDKQDKILYMNPVAMTLLPQLKDDRKDEVIEKLFSRQENVLDQNDRHYEIRISKGNRKSAWQGKCAGIYCLDI